MFTLTRPFSPCSSPASSPTPVVDSSPASSPDPDVIFDLPDPPPLSLVDPYAASAKANRAPPEYEKKPLTPPRSPSGNVPVKRARYAHWRPDSTPCLPVSPPNSAYVPHTVVVETAEQIEAAIWDEASTQVVDNADGSVNLDNRNLTHIPQSFISDISNVYIPPENLDYSKSSTNFFPTQVSASTATPAANVISRVRSFKRTRSTVGRDPKEIRLFLASNKITVLPLQLLTLQNMTVLSLRHNNLTFIPPEIVCLRGLKELNIAGNHLKYLPAEMLEMSLANLQVWPNKFPKDPYDEQLSSTTSRTEQGDRQRSVSDTKHPLSKIIPLVEMAFRVLLSPSLTSPGECLLEEHYDLPLDECPSDPTSPFSNISGKRQFPYPVPSHLRAILSTCVRYSVDPEELPSVDDLASAVTGTGHCPSPRHCDHNGGRLKSGVFVRHAEERYTWEPIIAGFRVGGYVPVRWRGCQWGCLDFLDNDGNGGVGDNDGLKLPEMHGVDLAQTAGDSSMDEDAVQVIQLSGVNGLDDFDGD